MGRIAATEHVSLDGVMEAPGGGEDHKHRGWTLEFDRAGDKRRLELTESRTLGEGIATLVFEPRRA